MTRRRVIVGIGAAVLAETPERELPAGLALQVPLQAVAAGHEGIAISRLGQDATADQVLSVLRENGVDVRHLQSDPDLPTARASLDANGRFEQLDDNAAFDQLQWDFDLSDVAQRADAVVFDALMRRSGQARSAVDRFLDECNRAVRVFDMTGCVRLGLDRNDVVSGLRHARVVAADEDALRMIIPGAAEGPPGDTAGELLRRGELDAVLVAQPDLSFAVHTAERTCTTPTIVDFVLESLGAAGARG